MNRIIIIQIQNSSTIISVFGIQNEVLTIT